MLSGNVGFKLNLQQRNGVFNLKLALFQPSNLQLIKTSLFAFALVKECEWTYQANLDGMVQGFRLFNLFDKACCMRLERGS